MILSDIRNYMQQHGQVSLADVALHFDIEPDAARGMLDIWVKKGKVQRRAATSSCGTSCSQCDTAATEIYVWESSAFSVQLSVPDGCDK
ncbi:MAG: FeoC-like transcriptional regulator [Gammaproteobacteria bacterium]|nr:FeoC-like transcriptional regulator [Gammaproteobacteria bacterium]